MIKIDTCINPQQVAPSTLHSGATGRHNAMHRGRSIGLEASRGDLQRSLALVADALSPARASGTPVRFGEPAFKQIFNAGYFPVDGATETPVATPGAGRASPGQRRTLFSRCFRTFVPCLKKPPEPKFGPVLYSTIGPLPKINDVGKLTDIPRFYKDSAMYDIIKQAAATCQRTESFRNAAAHEPAGKQQVRHAIYALCSTTASSTSRFLHKGLAGISKNFVSEKIVPVVNDLYRQPKDKTIVEADVRQVTDRFVQRDNQTGDQTVFKQEVETFVKTWSDAFVRRCNVKMGMGSIARSKAALSEVTADLITLKSDSQDPAAARFVRMTQAVHDELALKLGSASMSAGPKPVLVEKMPVAPQKPPRLFITPPPLPSTPPPDWLSSGQALDAYPGTLSMPAKSTQANWANESVPTLTDIASQNENPAGAANKEDAQANASPARKAGMRRIIGKAFSRGLRATGLREAKPVRPTISEPTYIGSTNNFAHTMSITEAQARQAHLTQKQSN